MDCRLGITFNLPTIINQYWLDYKQLYLGPAAFSTTLVVEEPRGIYKYNLYIYNNYFYYK